MGLQLTRYILMLLLLCFSFLFPILSRTSWGKKQEKLKGYSSLLSFTFYSGYSLLLLLSYMGFQDTSATADVGGVFQRMGLVFCLLLVCLYYANRKENQRIQWKELGLLSFALYLSQFVFAYLQYRDAIGQGGRVWAMPSLIPQFCLAAAFTTLALFILWKKGLRSRKTDLSSSV